MTESQQTSRQLAEQAASTPEHPRLKLFLLGFLTLYLELVLIRYLAGSVWNLGYFPNLVLLGTFVGMGVGFLLHRFVPARLSPRLFLGSLAALLLLVLLAKFAAPALPGFGQHGSEIAGEVYFTETPTGDVSSSYLMFVLWFLSVVLVFFFISQRTAKIFRLFKPLTAYTLDISGSVCGILTFTLFSWLQLSPYVWFLLAIPVYLLAMERRPSIAALVPVVGLICAAGLAWDQDLLLMFNPRAEGTLKVHWSPYQKVEYFKPAGQSLQYIYVNGIAHQNMQLEHGIRTSYYTSIHNHRRGTGLPPYKSVLVIGAGAGNDVSAALANGAEHVDAVEIDPVIAQLGREHHPLRPYDDPRVTVTIDDGRAFMRHTRRRYDLIIYALTDSLVKVSAMAQLRLENYLFTEESVRRAFSLLSETGDIVFYNYYRQPWLIEKYRHMTHAATGRWPRTIYRLADFEGLLISKQSKPSPAVAGSGKVDIPTDDWPFPYLQRRGMPTLYITALLVVTGMVLLFGLVLGRLERRRTQPSTARGDLPTKIAFVLMGLAFLLLETKSIVQFSLLFGTTWVNTSMVFFAVLVLVLAANWVGQLPKPPPLAVVYGLLLVSSLLTLFYPLSNLLQLDSAPLRFVLASLITFAPIFFANLLFSITFRHQTVPEMMFGWNLLGATLGGLLEYTSMALGYNALAIIVAVCYTATFGLLLLARRRQAGVAAEPTAAPAEQPAPTASGEAVKGAALPDRPAPLGRRRRALVAGTLFAGLVGVYHLNGDFLPAADVIASQYMASSLFEEGNLSFTRKEAPFMFRAFTKGFIPDAPTPDREGAALAPEGEHYYLVPTVHKGVFVNTFGFGSTLAALPVFGVLRLVVGNLQTHPHALWYGAKFAAACFVAGSAVFVFLSLLLFTRPRYALLVALAYGLGTCVWSISSQALWQTGPNEFFLAMGAYFLLRSRDSGWFAYLCGVASGCAVCCRPSSAVFVAIVGLFLLLENRRSALLFVLGGLPLALALLAYNHYYFGSPFITGQAIRGAPVALGKTGSAAMWQTPMWKGAAGLLISPSRGLLVYSPFLVFTLWGLVKAWGKDERFTYLRPISLGLITIFLLQFKWFDWWGGHCFGYRPLVDGMPLLVLFLAVVIDRIGAKPVLRFAFLGLVLWSIWVQVIGAFAYNERDWNLQRTEVRPVEESSDLTLSYGIPYTRRPANIDNKAHRHRLWSIRDSQILHYMRFFKVARRWKKTLVLARLAIAFLPTAPVVAQTGCSPPKAKDLQGVIDFGTAQSHEFLRSGWSIVDKKIDGRTVRWAVGGESKIEVSLAPRSGDRKLAFVAKPMRGIRGHKPQRVKVIVNGHPVGTVTMSPAWKRYKLLVPKKTLKVGPNEIVFKHDWCVQPNMINFHSPDRRRLTALYDTLSLTAPKELPHELSTGLGTAADREKLVLQGGVDDREEDGGRTFVRGPGPSPTFRFPLEPRGEHYLLTLEARLDTADDTRGSSNVSLNGVEVGKVPLTPKWANRALPIPADRFRAGVNTLKLMPASLTRPDALFAKLTLRPYSNAQTLDFGTAAARDYLLSGWGHDEVYDKRKSVWSIAPRSTVAVHLHLVAPSYRLKLTARAFDPTCPQVVTVSCNGQHVGELEVPKQWAQRSLTLPRRMLTEGRNVLGLAFSRTAQPASTMPGWADSRNLALLVDRLEVVPVASGK